MFVKKEGHTDMPLLIGFNVKKRKSNFKSRVIAD